MKKKERATILKGLKEGKISEERLDEILEMELDKKIKVTTLHIHTGSDIIKDNYFQLGFLILLVENH